MAPFDSWPSRPLASIWPPDPQLFGSPHSLTADTAAHTLAAIVLRSYSVAQQLVQDFCQDTKSGLKPLTITKPLEEFDPFLPLQPGPALPRSLHHPSTCWIYRLMTICNGNALDNYLASSHAACECQNLAAIALQFLLR